MSTDPKPKTMPTRFRAMIRSFVLLFGSRAVVDEAEQAQRDMDDGPCESNPCRCHKKHK